MDNEAEDDNDDDDDDNKLELGEFGDVVSRELLPLLLLLLFAMAGAGVVAVAVDDVVAVGERDRGSLIHWTMMGWLSWVRTLAPCFLCGDNIIVVVVVVSVCSFLSMNLLLCF